MARPPKPWFWKRRQAWLVTIDGTRHFLAVDKEAALSRFHPLMCQPHRRVVRSDSLAVIIDLFLDWCQKHRAADTYVWYCYRLERFVQAYPDLRTHELRPYHVQQVAAVYVCLQSEQVEAGVILGPANRCFLAWMPATVPQLAFRSRFSPASS